MRINRRNRLLKEKIKSLRALKRIILGLKRQGRKIVFTNGCFDLLHYGHARYLEDAKKRGDLLIVAVNSDSSVRKIKGEKRPLVGERDRAMMIAALESVDYVLIFKETTPLEVIKDIRPDIIVKGADWPKDRIVGGDLVSGSGGRVLRIKLVRNRSTTALINKIVKRFRA